MVEAEEEGVAAMAAAETAAGLRKPVGPTTRVIGRERQQAVGALSVPPLSPPRQAGAEAEGAAAGDVAVVSPAEEGGGGAGVEGGGGGVGSLVAEGGGVGGAEAEDGVAVGAEVND